MKTSMKPSCLWQPSLQQVANLKRARAGNFISYTVKPQDHNISSGRLCTYWKSHKESKGVTWFVPLLSVLVSVNRLRQIPSPRSQFRPICPYSPGKFCATEKWRGHPQNKKTTLLVPTPFTTLHKQERQHSGDGGQDAILETATHVRRQQFAEDLYCVVLRRQEKLHQGCRKRDRAGWNVTSSSDEGEENHSAQWAALSLPAQ